MSSLEKPSDCKFWSKGMCTHIDAPPDDKRCIGMGDDILGGCVAWRDNINMRVNKQSGGKGNV